MAGRNVKTAGYSNEGRLRRKAERKARAEARQAERDKRSPEEQLNVLLKRPGKSQKEFQRLVAETVNAGRDCHTEVFIWSFKHNVKE